jgi:hypothetical protein
VADNDDKNQVVVELGGVRLEGFAEGARIKVEPFTPASPRRSVNRSGEIELTMTSDSSAVLDELNAIAAKRRAELIEARAVKVIRQLAEGVYCIGPGVLDARYWRRRRPGSAMRKRVEAARRMAADRAGAGWAIAMVTAESLLVMESAMAALFQGPAEVPAGAYRCAMCGGVFETDWSDDEAKADARAKGIDPARSGVVCDDCYQRTPFGRRWVTITGTVSPAPGEACVPLDDEDGA